MSVSGIDSNPTPNQQFDDSDHIISTVALDGLYAETAEGLGPGSTLAEIHGVARYANPDRSADVPPYGEYPGGKMEYYFTQGVFVGYELDTASFFTVTRTYPRPPDGVISPSAGTLNFGGNTIQCGDGYQSGSFRDAHTGVLGAPDWDYEFEMEVDTQYGTQDVNFYIDSYRILGMEFIGGDDSIFIYDVDRLVLVSLYAPYYGKTSQGHGIGSTKAEWESELGSPTSTVTESGVTSHIYTAGSRLFSITYSNNGASQDDIATFLVLNYQTAP
jgi:hypothetical protein